MKRKILKTLCLLTALAMLAACIPAAVLAKTETDTRDIWDGSIAEGFAGGSGTEEDPYLITNGAELAYLAERVNAGESYEGCFFKLTEDICLNDTEGWQNWSGENAPANLWIPIGGNFGYTEGGFPYPHQFCGRFNGNGHTISGAYFYTDRNLNTHPVGGIFGLIGDGEVTDLNVRDSKFIDENTGTPLGAVVAYVMGGAVRNCSSNSMLVGTDTVSGIVGVLTSGIDGELIYEGTVENCINSGSVAGWLQVGGIVGGGYGFVANCRNEGSVFQTEEMGGVSRGFGGIAGSFYCGEIRNCVNSGTVNARSAIEAAGIVGAADDGEGGTLTIECCCNEGEISGQAGVSGIIAYDGDTNVIIRNCYNRAAISGERSVGGITAVCSPNGSSVGYVNCYNSGTISGAEDFHPFIGGLFSQNAPELENCYYLSGCCENEDEYAEALTDEQLRLAGSYEGFDFEGIWTMEGDPEYPYAELIGQYVEPAPVIPGDVDCNGTVTVSDAIMALRASMGLLELTPEQFTAADMDGSETVTVSDAIMILRTAMGLV